MALAESQKDYLTVINSELLMPTIGTKGYSYDDFLSAIERQGYYEIKNPRVYKPGTNETDEEKVEKILKEFKEKYYNPLKVVKL